MVIFLFACLFSALCSGRCTSYYQPGWVFSLRRAGPAPQRLLGQKQHGVSGGSFHSGLLLKSSFPFPGSSSCYRKFPRGKAIVSITAVQGQCSAQVALQQLHSSGQVIPLLITATQLYEASMDHMQLSFSSGTVHSIGQHVDVELMKSQLVPLSEKLAPIEVIKPLPVLHRVCEKQLLSGTESSYHWSNSEHQEEGCLGYMKPRNA